jgi:SAM-dependent methyltransferase
MDSNDWDKRYEAADSIWSLTPNQFVVEYLSDLPAGSLIDLAGGEGRNARWFANRGWQAENADFSAVALSKFSERAEQEGLVAQCVATCIDATASEPTFALAPVDLGMIVYLQIDSDGLAIAIISLANAIKPNGTFFGVWHARENLDGGFGGPQDPAVLPTQDELRSACVRAGLSEPLIEIKHRSVQVDDTERIAFDVVVLAVKP